MLGMVDTQIIQFLFLYYFTRRQLNYIIIVLN